MYGHDMVEIKQYKQESQKENEDKVSDRAAKNQRTPKILVG